jgi:hypothetical protein
MQGQIKQSRKDVRPESVLLRIVFLASLAAARALKKLRRGEKKVKVSASARKNKAIRAKTS